MKTKTLLFLAFSLMTHLTFSQASFNYVPNFNYANNLLLSGINNVTEPLGNYGVVNKNFTLTTSLPTIRVELVDNAPITFTRDVGYLSEAGEIIWRGNSTSGPCFNCELQIKEYGGDLSASIFKPNGIVALSDIGNSNYVFYDRTMINADCDIDHFPSVAINPNVGLTPGGFNRTAARRSTCGGVETFSMIIAYTPEFAATFPVTDRQQEINTFLDGVVESVNESYRESDLDVRVRLAFSYQTPDSEFGNKDDDFDAFSNVVRCTGLFCGGEKWREYDEIWAYRNDFNADVAILLISQNVGGRADRSLNMGMYGRNGADDRNYGVAHEIGHMFNLEHNREEFSWIERIFIGGKNAYGYRNADFRTVMSYGNDRDRVPLYSDPDYDFPDGGQAGDKNAKARRYVRDNLGRVITKNDYTNYNISNLTIESDETLNQFARNNITTSNFTVQTNSVVALQAENTVTFGPGTNIAAGSDVTVSIVDCATAVFRSAQAANEPEGETIDELVQEVPEALENEVFSLYPNPVETGVLNLTYHHEGEVVSFVKIYAMDGAEVYFRYYDEMQHQINGQIDVSNLGAGTYIVNVCQNNGDCQSQRFVLK